METTKICKKDLESWLANYADRHNLTPFWLKMVSKNRTEMIKHVVALYLLEKVKYKYGDILEYRSISIDRYVALQHYCHEFPKVHQALATSIAKMIVCK